MDSYPPQHKSKCQCHEICDLNLCCPKDFVWAHHMTHVLREYLRKNEKLRKTVLGAKVEFFDKKCLKSRDTVPLSLLVTMIFDRMMCHSLLSLLKHGRLWKHACLETCMLRNVHVWKHACLGPINLNLCRCF